MQLDVIDGRFDIKIDNQICLKLFVRVLAALQIRRDVPVLILFYCGL